MHLAPLLLALSLAASPCDPAPASLLAKTLRIFGIPANPGTRGSDEPEPAGFLELTRADGTGSRIRLTQSSDLRSPIFASDDRHVLALRAGQLVRVATEQGLVEPEFLMDLPGAVRLAGFSVEDPGLLVVLVERERQRYAAVVCLDARRVVELNGVERDDLNRLLGRLRSGERRYDDGTSVESRENSEHGRDVFVVSGNRAINVSKCGSDRCTQGALSRDGARGVFVRTPAGS